MPRLEVAVISRDGEATIVNASRPATLVAFEDAHEGKMMPETIREIAWVVHHALGIEQPLDEWLPTLEDVSAQAEDVALARRIIAGDEDARKIALGELPRPAASGDEGADDARPPPGPAVEDQLGAVAGGRS
ncbi:MAG TPA: hypothetical protein VGJ32_08760 [Solirubrobacteraceae bacterium]